MLKKIEITNFKSFNNTFIFDLSDTNSYTFNQECVKNKIVNKAIIYGSNGCGKSNLGFAIFDLISHLTDKETDPGYYTNYINANNDNKHSTFSYEFVFENNTVQYTYTKSDYQTLISEKLLINGEVFASINRLESEFFETNAKGAETLNKNIGNSNISILSYISKNTVLEDNERNNAFNKFKEFINGMLYFRSLDDKCYLGYAKGTHTIPSDIIEHDNLKDFEEFLNHAGIKCRLTSKNIFGNNQIYFKFGKTEIDFFDIASSGTKALALFYFWYQRLKNDKDISFLFIDEFDAFYHHSLSWMIIEKLKQVTDTQIILTTHNTSIISNDLLRPDCYFLMYPEYIKPISKATKKELREAHNIEKMYRAGAFE